MKKKFLLATCALLLGTCAFSQSLTTKSVSVFKNGQSFFLKSGTLYATDGRWLLPEPAPAALYGTLWFNSPEGTLNRVSSYPDTLVKKKQAAVTAIYDLVRANLGKKATVFFEKEGSFSGVVTSIGPAYTDPKDKPVFNESSLVTLHEVQKPERWLTIPAGQIRYLTFMEESPTLLTEQEKTKVRHLIELNFSNKKTAQPLDLLYLSNGLNWAPQYLLELTSDQSATLTLQAEIANDAENLDDTEVNLVVGVPNFQFASRLAYLVDFLSALQPALRLENTFSNAIMSQRANFSGESFDDAVSPSEGVEGSGAEDLFFYTLKNVSLPKGGRSIQRIFQEKIKVAHLYECRLPANSEGNVYGESFLFTPGQHQPVLHTVRAANDTKTPWTTAPVLVMSAARPISQDLLAYTPASSHAYIKLTEAPDVKAEHAERELSREKNAVSDQKRGLYLDLIQVESKIKITNYKDKKLDLRLQRTISGNLKKSGKDWIKEEIVNTGNSRNRLTNVTWETSVEAKGQLEITYTYEVYVPAY